MPELRPGSVFGKILAAPESCKRLVLLLLLLLPTIIPGRAQQNTQFVEGNYIFDITVWGAGEGLPSWRIRDIIKDRTGRMWLATDVGLVGFDGVTFEHYTHDRIAGMPINLARIAEDFRGNLWLFGRSEEKSLIYIFDPYQETLTPLSAYVGQNIEFDLDIVENITRLDRNIWIGDIANARMAHFSDQGVWTVLNFPAFSATRYYQQLYPAKSGGYWLLDYENLFLTLFDARGNVIKAYSRAPLSRSGGFWYGDDRTLYYIETQSVPCYRVTRILECSETEGFVPVDKQAYGQLRLGNAVGTLANQYPVLVSNSEGFLWLHGNPIFLSPQSIWLIAKSCLAYWMRRFSPVFSTSVMM
jgi:hypothetical protein